MEQMTVTQLVNIFPEFYRNETVSFIKGCESSPQLNDIFST